MSPVIPDFHTNTILYASMRPPFPSLLRRCIVFISVTKCASIHLFSDIFIHSHILFYSSSMISVSSSMPSVLPSDITSLSCLFLRSHLLLPLSISISHTNPIRSHSVILFSGSVCSHTLLPDRSLTTTFIGSHCDCSAQLATFVSLIC